MITTHFTTGDVARLFGRTEPQIADLVRRGKIRPQPEILAGRRLWTPSHLIQAADALGILTDEVRARIDSVFPESVADLQEQLLANDEVPSHG